MSVGKIHIWEPSNHRRNAWPITVSVPFQKGAVTAPRQVIARDPRTGEIPAQRRALAKWPDKSIKWLLLDFPIDLDPRERVDVGIVIDSDPVGAEIRDGLRVEWAGENLHIDTGALQCDLASESGGMLKWLSAHGVSYTGRPGTVQIRLPDGRILDINEGPTTVDIEENGPQRSVIAVSGTHGDSTCSMLDYTLRLQVYANQPTLHWYYTLTNREPNDVEITGIQMVHPIDFAADESWAHVGRDHFRYHMPEGWLSVKTDGLETRATDGRHTSGNLNTIRAEVPMEPFVVVGDDTRMVLMQPKWAHFLYSKAAHYYGRALRYDIWPDTADPWTFKRGMAKTHELILNLSPPASSYDEAMPAVAPVLRPVVPAVDPACVASTGVLPSFFSAQWEKYPALETQLMQSWITRARAYGMLHYGDAPSPSYTAQGRGRKSKQEEALIWVNNEYDLPYMAIQQFLRSGDRNVYLRDVEPTIWHMMDVDTVHHDPDNPIHVGGQVVHSANHVGPPFAGVDPSHEWVEGLIHYHLLTGLEYPRERALALGEHLIRWTAEHTDRLYKDTTAARVSGWALIALTALYEFTHDSRFLATAKEHAKGIAHRIEKGIGHLTETVSYGFPYRAGFMTDIAVAGLKRLHDVTADDQWKDLALRMLDDQLEHLIAPNGLLWYKELPENHRPMMSLFDLEVMAYAYEWTRNRKYLNHGLRLFSLAGPHQISQNQSGVFLEEAPEGALYEQVRHFRRDAHSMLWFRFLIPFCELLDRLDLLKEFEPPMVRLPEQDDEG